MNEPLKCLEDINAAISLLEKRPAGRVESNQMQTVKKKLLERQERCKVKVSESKALHDRQSTESLNRRMECESYFQLKNPSQIIESAEDFVEMKDDPVRGRHVTVSQNVSPGKGKLRAVNILLLITYLMNLINR
jgi:hypothetical protein